LIVLFLIAVPANATSIGDPTFAKPYFDREERILTTITRMPFASQVPSDVRPIVESLHLEQDRHRLPAQRGPLRPPAGVDRTDPRAEADEYGVQLGLDQQVVTSPPTRCKQFLDGVDIDPEKHKALRFLTPMNVVLRDGDTTSTPVMFDPSNISPMSSGFSSSTARHARRAAGSSRRSFENCISMNAKRLFT
jgi:hypothetical protein